MVGTMVSGGAMPFAIILGGNDGVLAFPAPPVVKAILTGYRVSKKSGIGITHTLRERIYAHVFGEKTGRATISGMAFAGLCNTDGGYVGFDAVNAYYESVGASRNGMPVRLIFGPRTALFGMMSDLDFAVEDPTTGVGLFSFGFHLFPRSQAAMPIWTLIGGEEGLDADENELVATEEDGSERE